jgi:hypothetical protein
MAKYTDWFDVYVSEKRHRLYVRTALLAIVVLLVVIAVRVG